MTLFHPKCKLFGKKSHILLHKGAWLAYNFLMMDTVLFLQTQIILFAQRSALKKPGGAFDVNTTITLIVGAGIVAAITVVAYYVGSHLRKGALEREKPPTMSDHLKAFQEAAAEGNMTAKEYSIVKTHLAQKIMAEINQENSQNQSDNDLPKFIPQ